MVSVLRTASTASCQSIGPSTSRCLLLLLLLSTILVHTLVLIEKLERETQASMDDTALDHRADILRNAPLNWSGFLLMYVR
jgi:hypothetical protein